MIIWGSYKLPISSFSELLKNQANCLDFCVDIYECAPAYTSVTTYVTLLSIAPIRTASEFDSDIKEIERI